jgi:hypothetical protein
MDAGSGHDQRQTAGRFSKDIPNYSPGVAPTAKKTRRANIGALAVNIINWQKKAMKEGKRRSRPLG